MVSVSFHSVSAAGGATIVSTSEAIVKPTGVEGRAESMILNTG